MASVIRPVRHHRLFNVLTLSHNINTICIARDSMEANVHTYITSGRLVCISNLFSQRHDTKTTSCLPDHLNTRSIIFRALAFPAFFFRDPRPGSEDLMSRDHRIGEGIITRSPAPQVVRNLSNAADRYLVMKV